MDRAIILKYVFDHFYRYFEIEHEALNQLNISYPNSSQSFFECSKMIPSSISWKEYDSNNLPLLFEQNTLEKWFEIKDNNLIFNYDMPGMIFYFLSGWQEEHGRKFDQYNRFPYSGSIQEQLNITELPAVNYYFFILKAGLEQLLNREIKLKQTFRINITHDIDIIHSGWKSPIKKALQQGQLLKAVRITFNKLFLNKSPNQNLKQIIDIEKSLGLTSTFYFLPTTDKVKRIQNADYDINENYIRDIITTINSEKDFSIGLHTPSLEDLTPENISTSSEKISPTISKNRFHYLALQQKDLIHFEETDITEDSSLGFAEHIGFRHSTAWPFHPFDFVNKKAFTTLETPLLAMDVSLTNPNYMNLNSKQVYSQLESLLNQTKKVKGTFTFLVHNNTFFDYDWKLLTTLFQKHID